MPAVHGEYPGRRSTTRSALACPRAPAPTTQAGAVCRAAYHSSPPNGGSATADRGRAQRRPGLTRPTNITIRSALSHCGPKSLSGGHIHRNLEVARRATARTSQPLRHPVLHSFLLLTRGSLRHVQGDFDCTVSMVGNPPFFPGQVAADHRPLHGRSQCDLAGWLLKFAAVDQQTVGTVAAAKAGRWSCVQA